MGKVKIPRGLPKCELIEQLARKADQRSDTDLDFLGTLEAFRRRVSGEVRQINQLFPEYTPHDEQYHLKRLFHVADTVLGTDRVEEMNSAELLLLAIALYGHDWGMAVNEAEKEFILTGNVPEGSSRDDFCLMVDETERLLRFARDEGLELDDEGRPSHMPIELWREYVRETHADRSGARVRLFFDPIDGGLADAGARVCLGHWLDFEDLQDYRSYPLDFSLLRETVNLRAVAVYVRLIDLFDLAEDRTPYVIWKFVAPRDPRSKMEWRKHRALRPVTCPEYQQGRVVVVDGSTDDHEVFAALEDLHMWCEQQLRGCSDLLARMNDPRHQLDLYHVVWRVAPRGFEPVSIQFEFDRDEMFEMLSDEIYQGDPYVFLRELLQNSIDAIRMRREVRERGDSGAGNVGLIRVTVEHGQNGDAIVTWQDDGLGMDEFVVRNYLAVAGKSYYRSADFEREGLDMDPISRFGIGILSCFIVADRVEIDTYREPYLPPVRDPLSIRIPAMRRQFRIQRRPQGSAKVGTTVRVFVSGRKLPTEGDDAAQPLDVTSYLSIVAGFVEFPILVNEGDRNTIILHPRIDAEEALDGLKLGGEWDVRQLDLSYPWSEAIAPQDLGGAKESLQEHVLDLAADLGLDGYEGSITYLVPKEEKMDLFSGGPTQVRVAVRGEPHESGTRVRWRAEWERYEAAGPIGVTRSVRWRARWERHEAARPMRVTRSGRRSHAFAVYRDGILVSTAGPPRSPWARLGTRLPAAHLVVNLAPSRAPALDLARVELRGDAGHWDAPLYRAYAQTVLDECLEGLLSLQPSERLYQMGRLLGCHKIDVETLFSCFPRDKWPVPFLQDGGRLEVLEWEAVAGEPVYMAPEPIADVMKDLYHSAWWSHAPYQGPLTQWVGGACVAATGSRGGMRGHHDPTAALWRRALEGSHCLSGARFLRPPRDAGPPLRQEVWVPRARELEPVDVDAALEKAVDNPVLLDGVERTLVCTGYAVADFHPPFEHCLAYGGEVLNLGHPITQALVRVDAALQIAARVGSLPEYTHGRLEDSLLNTVRCVYHYEEGDEDALGAAFRDLRSLVLEERLVKVSAVECLSDGRPDFVEGSLGGWDWTIEFWSYDADDIKPFGQPVE